MGTKKAAEIHSAVFLRYGKSLMYAFGLFWQRKYRLFEESHPLFAGAVAEAAEIDEAAAVVVAAVPSRRAVCSNHALAAFERLGDDEAEIVRERQQDERVAPAPDALLLPAERGRDSLQPHPADAGGALHPPDGFLEAFHSF